MAYNYSIKGTPARVADILGISLNYRFLPKNVLLYDVESFYYNNGVSKLTYYSKDNKDCSRSCAKGIFDVKTKHIHACTGSGELHTKFTVLHESVHYLINKIGLNLSIKEEEATCDLVALSVLCTCGLLNNKEDFAASGIEAHLVFTFISDFVLHCAETIEYMLLEGIVPADEQYQIRHFVTINRHKLKTAGVLYKEFRKPRNCEF